VSVRGDSKGIGITRLIGKMVGETKFGGRMDQMRHPPAAQQVHHGARGTRMRIVG